MLLHQTSVSEKTRCWGAGLWLEGDTISSAIMEMSVSPFYMPAFQGMAWKFFYLTRGFSYFLHGKSLCISTRHVVYGSLYMESPRSPLPYM